MQYGYKVLPLFLLSFYFKHHPSTRWCTSVIPALRRLWQEDEEFEPGLGYIGSSRVAYGVWDVRPRTNSESFREKYRILALNKISAF